MSKKIFQSQVLTRGAENGVWVTFGPTTTPNFFPTFFFTQRIWVLDGYFVMFGMLGFTPIIFISKLWVSEGLFWACCLLSFNQLLYKTKLLLSVPNFVPNMPNLVPNLLSSLSSVPQTVLRLTPQWLMPNIVPSLSSTSLVPRQHGQTW